MTPEMKRELLLALDVMFNGGPDFVGEWYRGQRYNSIGDKTLARVQSKPFRWKDLVFLGSHEANTPKDQPLRAGFDRTDPGFLWILEQLGNPDPYHINDWKRNVLCGPLSLHAFRVAVKIELNNLQVA